LQDTFFDPLLKLLPGGAANDYQVQSASFCLRKLVQYFIRERPELVDYVLAHRIVTATIKSKVWHTNLVETVRDLLRHFDKGISGITNDGVGLFTYSINSMKTLMTNQESAGQHLPLKKIEDIKSVLKLQKQMVESSFDLAKLIVPHHMAPALAALALFKNIKNPKIKAEVDALNTAWNTLK
jgi:hypothetical protein